MSWRMDSTAGAAIWDTQPLTSDDLALRDEEIEWLAQQGRHQWKIINGRLAASGHPTANVGSYTSAGAYPPTAAQTSTAVTTATPGTAIWTSHDLQSRFSRTRSSRQPPIGFTRAERSNLPPRA